eukprot:TRINITY_DN7113_c0_g1_i8.p1 TRINITY_DN7113_c0_g1~~TRINITY_DN7113_c0_g1_i8.p1  ORF type:complete len:165 (+),score=13.66 TRINITY_DN7113_c0_g1_i8:225-719(+)
MSDLTSFEKKLIKLSEDFESLQNYRNKQEVLDTLIPLLQTYEELGVLVIQSSATSGTREQKVIVNGFINVKYTGRNYACPVHIQLTPNFPDEAPIVHFINPDISRFIVADPYKKDIVGGGTMVKLNFYQLQRWSCHRNLATVIEEIQLRLSQNYIVFDLSLIHI